MSFWAFFHHLFEVFDLYKYFSFFILQFHLQFFSFDLSCLPLLCLLLHSLEHLLDYELMNALHPNVSLQTLLLFHMLLGITNISSNTITILLYYGKQLLTQGLSPYLFNSPLEAILEEELLRIIHFLRQCHACLVGKGQHTNSNRCQLKSLNFYSSTRGLKHFEDS